MKQPDCRDPIVLRRGPAPQEEAAGTLGRSSEAITHEISLEQDPERLRQLASELYRAFLETERKKVRERMEHTASKIAAS